MQQRLRLRHEVVRRVRDHLHEQGFIEVETPILTRSTPEGARDYLVPSRVQRGAFFALPQSPQLFKQILMIGGVDRYYQIARCFRDEDLRADRQPEFTQIDLEMSFVTAEDVMQAVEPMIADLFTMARGRETPRPFPVMSYADAMLRYGTDRPDLRVELELADFSGCFAGTGFRVFADALAQGRRIRGLVAPGGGAALSRRELDDLVGFATSEGAGGLTWIRIAADGWQSPAVKFLGDAERERLTAAGSLKAGDLLILLAEPEARASAILSQLRVRLGQRLGRIAEGADRFLWVVDFPLLERDPDSQRYVAIHHPFTAPHGDDLDRLESDPLAVRSQAYDLVLNGIELGGGSIRIHRPDDPGARARPAGHVGERSTRAFRVPARGPLVWGATPWRAGVRAGSAGHAARGHGLDPRGDRVSQDPTRHLSAHRCADPGRAGAASRARDPPRRVTRPRGSTVRRASREASPARRSPQRHSHG